MRLNQLYLLPLIFISFSASATIPTWKIDNNASKLTFTATQNGAPVSGSFKKFSADIQFDKTALNDSKAKIEIDMNSVSSTYADLTSTLTSSDWFDVKVFPKAVFIANHFSKVSEDQYTADGTLTIRDQTVPISFNFQLKEIDKNKDQASGSVTIKRTAFKVGGGEWASTDEVKDEVVVNFDIQASKS